MASNWLIIAILLVCSLLVDRSFAYPGGAPLGACESLSPEAGHGAQSQNVADAPFSVVATTNKYKAGDKIGGL